MPAALADSKTSLIVLVSGMAVRSQTDHANALGCELGGQISSECLLGGHRRTVAAVQREPFRAGSAVTVMITPDLFGIMCRAARRAVRKYDVA